MIRSVPAGTEQPSTTMQTISPRSSYAEFIAPLEGIRYPRGGMGKKERFFDPGKQMCAYCVKQDVNLFIRT